MDLTARLAVTGIGGSYGDNVEVLREGDGRSWQGGVTLGFPLGQNPDRQRFHQRVLEKQREEVDLERLRLDIVQQVREQHRRVGINHRRVEVSQLAERLADAGYFTGMVADTYHMFKPSMNFTRGFLKNGLKDRAITRNLDWGLPVPVEGYEDRRLYVWFEAVIGYLSASKEWARQRGDPEAWRPFWEAHSRCTPTRATRP